MKKNIIKRLVTYIGVILISYAIYVVGSFVVGVLEAQSTDLRQKYSKLSTEKLLSEMDNYNWFRADVAYEVLTDRKEKRAIPKIVNKMKHDKGNVSMYVQGLTAIGDVSVIPHIVSVMRSQKDQSANNDTYFISVICLAKLKHEPIWPILTKLAKSSNAGDMRLAIDAMIEFGRKDAIPYLREMEVRLNSGKYEPWVEHDRHLGKNVESKVSPFLATDAIDYLEKNGT